MRIYNKPTGEINEEIRKGYKGLVWSYPSKVTGKCLFVSQTTKNPGTRWVSGAHKFWESEDKEINNIIYIPELGISGKRSDLTKALMGGGYSDEEAKEFINDGIKKSNYETTHAERLKEAKSLKKGKKQEFDDICSAMMILSDHISNGNEICYLDTKKQKLGSYCTQKKVVEKKTPKETMIARYEALSPDMVLDFTKLEVTDDKYKGVTSRKIKKENRKSYYHAGDYAIVSKDKNNFKIALKMLEPEDARSLYKEASSSYRRYEESVKEKELEDTKKKKKKEKERMEKERKEKESSSEDGKKKEIESMYNSDEDDVDMDIENTESSEEPKKRSNKKSNH
jgi:hypothetical protein